MSYTKLFSKIIHSTIWREANHVRLVWITMLAMADRDGVVEASIPGLADAARVSLDECLQALVVLKSPDPYSRTKVKDGRRIEDIDGGWVLVTYEIHKELRSAEHTAELAAERQRRKRERDKSKDPDDTVTSHALSRGTVTNNAGHDKAEASPSPSPEEQTNTPQAEARSVEVRRVFDRWREITGHTGARLDPGREKKIKARLREFTADTLCVALGNFPNSPFHNGENDTGTTYDELKLLLRDAAQVEKFLALTSKPRPRRSGRAAPTQPNHGLTGFEGVKKFEDTP